MARSDQYMGLNEWSRVLVHQRHEVREVGHRLLSSGATEAFDRTVSVPVAHVETIGQIAGAWVDWVSDLHRYTLPDGRVFEEFLQCDPWHSGPCYFIALKDGEGNEVPESLWTEEETGL